jgi:pre-mRNA cleavage complex 2 protein Pcf11
MADLDPKKVEAILQDYAETLEVLTINSKPLINDLTMAADRYKPLAPQIIGVIESRLFEVPVNQKLPLLYLLDSIMKNLRGRYLEVINTKMVAIFCHCFEKLTEPKIRISLYKLRQTWNPFVVKKKLAAIDKHVHALDPNWPVTATVTAPTSPTIHVNPDFLVTGEKGPRKSSPAGTTSSSAQHPVSVTVTAAQPKQPASSAKETAGSTTSLEQKRKSVLEAQKRKKEELMAKGTTPPVSQQSSSSSSAVPARTTDSAPVDPRRESAAVGGPSVSAVPGRVAGKASGVAGKAAGVAGKAAGVAGKAAGVAGKAAGVAGKAAGVTGKASGMAGKATKAARRGKKRSTVSPRRPLSSRSSLSPDW